MKYMRYIIGLFFALNVSLCFAEVTLDAILEQELTATGELANALPHRDTSTPEKMLLGYLRATAKTSMRDLLYFFTPEFLMTELNMQNLDEITNEAEQELADSFQDYKLTLKSYQITTNDNFVDITVVMHFSTTTVAGRTERQILRAKQLDGEWKFVQQESYSAY